MFIFENMWSEQQSNSDGLPLSIFFALTLSETETLYEHKLEMRACFFNVMHKWMY